ncbi:uncharacterized protein TNCV_1951891 [Trichonephila clavipes]|nr:uncharacterized protein TNCV_1951891 [Trichonephila clavipes]
MIYKGFLRHPQFQVSFAISANRKQNPSDPGSVFAVTRKNVFQNLSYFGWQGMLSTMLLSAVRSCLGVRFAYLGVPGSVSRGDPIWLDCGYDLEGDELYSVKWYKDNVEFYRFLPSDIPSAQMYSLDGVFLDLLRSNATHAFLYTSNLDTEGTYGCEVSTEVPSFRTIKAGKELRVHVIPKDGPKIFGVQKTYRIGDLVNMTCLFGPSKPPAQITWYINGEEAPQSYVYHNHPSADQEEDLLISESRLSFALEPPRLWQGSLSVRCIASLSQVHATSSLELIVGEGTSGAEFQRSKFQKQT